MQKEVLDKYKVEDSKRGASRGSKREAYKGRGALPEWRLERRSRKY